MTAPAPSPYEQSEIDRFDIFAEERVVEQALDEHALAAFTGTESACACDRRWVSNREYRAHLAAAAVAAYRSAQDGGAEEAVRYPCYCLPGPAHCDDPFNWCDRKATS